MMTEQIEVKRNTIRKSSEKEGFIKSVFIDDFYSAALRRSVRMEVLLPPFYDDVPDHTFPVLYINDGQLLNSVSMRKALTDCYILNRIPPVIVVGVHAHNRMQEYGVAASPDFKNRGGKANKYSRFVTNELIPLINKNFQVDKRETAIMGFSLGGLSALDISWNNPGIFSTVGIFSGSLWWRSKDYRNGYSDANDRIAHNMIRNGKKREGMRFWFQCGTHDETADRNENGIIDSIDDTLDLINELKQHGYKPGDELHYVEVINGMHNEKTWGDVLPLFLEFAFGKHNYKVK